MKKRHVVSGIVTLVVGLGTEACTLGSDTYITSAPGSASTGSGGDAGAEGGSAEAASNLKAGPAECSGAAFAKVDVSKLTPCEGGKGHCWDKAKTPMADVLLACADPTEVCVPDEVLEAGGSPLPSCTSIVGPGGCITASLIPELEKQGGGILKPDVCDPDQVCAPCNDPTNGNAPTPFCQPVGVFEEVCGAASPQAPGSDGGASPPAMAGCCTSKGKSNGVCIAETAIPEAQRGDAPEDSCAEGNRCVPKAFVEGKPVSCNSGLFGGGVCLDACFNEMMGFASMFGVLGKDRCGDTEVCVPCAFMSGQGVPGCQ